MNSVIYFRDIIESGAWKEDADPLTFVIGKSTEGEVVLGNFRLTHHILIYGRTDAGKTTLLNTIICSLLYRNRPSDLKLIIADPKQIEMHQYEDIPHLLSSIIVSYQKIITALKWALSEINHRTTELTNKHLTNIDDYNTNYHDHFPYVIIVIDGLTDFIPTKNSEFENLIMSIVQKGHTVGVYLVLSTQSTHIINNLTKIDFPSRFAFTTVDKKSSQKFGIIGANKLLTHGDMLAVTPELSCDEPLHVQCALISDTEINSLTRSIKVKEKPTDYIDYVGYAGNTETMITGFNYHFEPNDPTVRKAIEILLLSKKLSAATLQTFLGKGHNYVSGLIDYFKNIGAISIEEEPRGHHRALISSMKEFDNLAKKYAATHTR